MTDASAPTRFAEGEFRVGRVLGRTFWVLSRNFWKFVLVSGIASLPMVLLLRRSTADASASIQSVGLMLLGFCLAVVVGMFCQAIVLNGAFQGMRGRPVSLVESLQTVLRHFFPILGLIAFVSFCAVLGLMLLIIPGLIVLTVWFVAMPACVVEKLGPFQSLARSARLTGGYRWKVFGLMLPISVADYVVSPVLDLIPAAPLADIGSLIWSAIYYAFYAIAVVVAYHDLRVAKEGVDIEQIAAVFD
jgi:hypothetical protein